MLQRIALLGGSPEIESRIDAAPDLVPGHASEGEQPPRGIAAVLLTQAGDAAIAVLSAAALDRTRLLELISYAIDAREGNTPENSLRVRDTAARFAQQLELPQEQCLALEHAALLRGIGKLRLSNDVLLKKTLLTYDDWLLLQRHPDLGAELLEELGFEPAIVEIVRTHSECFDGTGYPAKLEGTAIPLAGRIMRLINVFCAMTSPRHYRKTVASIDDAIAYLRQERGKHYDPALVDAFLEHKVWEQPA